MDTVKFTRTLDRFTLNPVLNGLARLGFTPPGVVILETTGRRSGKRRWTPVGARVEGDTVWVVAEHGHRNGYVRNIRANPRVRVLAGRRWRRGVAHLMEGDDPRKRLDVMVRGTVGLRVVEAVTRALMTEPLTVRIDLEPA